MVVSVAPARIRQLAKGLARGGGQGWVGVGARYIYVCVPFFLHHLCMPWDFRRSEVLF